MRRAGFWRRGVALAVDVVAGAVIAGAAAVGVFYAAVGDGRTALAQYLFDVTALLVFLAYQAQDVWPGRTPGKIALGLTIGNVDGTPADRWGRLLRWSTKWFPYLVALESTVALHPTLLEQLAGFMNAVILVGCLQALDEDKRAWHDEWSRTAVFRRPPPAPPAATPPPLPVPA